MGEDAKGEMNGMRVCARNGDRKAGSERARRVESTWVALESGVYARAFHGSFEGLRCISFGKYSNAMLHGEPHQGDPGLVSEGRREHSQEEEEADSSPV